MSKITVDELDQHGVVVDLDRTGAVSGRLSKAQNAIADPLGEKGSIRKRPGLLAVNATAGNGVVRGGIGVPRLLGSAGPDIGNPFTDIDVTIAQYTTSIISGTGYVQRLGTTFDDISFWYFWDWNEDFSEFEEFPFSSWEDLLEIPNPTDDLFDITGDGDSILKVSGADVNTIVPVTLFGDVTGFWYLTLDTALTHDTDNDTTYTNTQTLIFPTGSVRAYNALGSGTGGSSDANYPLASWFSGASSKEDGYPTCVLHNTLYYAGGYDDYTVGTNAPPLRAYDGYSDRIVARIPRNLDVSSTAEPKAIVSLLAANGKVYISTLDGGTNGAAGGTIMGSVYQFDPPTQQLTKLGATFPTGHLPYSLCWAYGRLWCGTSINQLADTEPGRVYWICPDADTTISLTGIWTLDKTFSANEAMVNALAVFQGKLYAAVDYNGTGASNSCVYTRTTAGVWSASDTAAVGTEATGLSRGYSSLLVWPPENASVSSPTSALFAVRHDVTGDAGTGALRKFNGSTWSTVHTWDFTNTGTSHLDFTYALSSTTIKPVLWLTRGINLFPNSTDGTTWTNRAAGLTTAAGLMGPTAGFGGLVLQLMR